jgi:anhydro-N-acetylmuramic acid kinase
MSFTTEEIFLGIMSGTSCDGLDLALVGFQEKSGRMHYRFLQEKMIPYHSAMQKRLLSCTALSALDLVLLEHEWTILVADSVNAFLSRSEIKPNCIGFHGHTVFHRPDLGYTMQMGSGATLASRCGIDVVCDFRQQDVARNGQGAPLVPLGDRDLFPEYEAFLNLGGFANATLRNSRNASETISAFDICAANIVLNRYAALLGKEYDAHGEEARQGQINLELLDSLNTITENMGENRFKSLGVEWLETHVIPRIEQCRINMIREQGPQSECTRSILATFTEHIAVQCGKHFRKGNVLVSGGGTHNTYLLERIQQHCLARLEKADKKLVDFKEALIFAYLAYCRVHLKENTLVDATGASKPSIAGALYKA